MISVVSFNYSFQIQDLFCVAFNLTIRFRSSNFNIDIALSTQLDNCCLHHKETLKKSEIATLVITAFVQKGWPVDQTNKVNFLN